MDSSTGIHYQSVEQKNERGTVAKCDPRRGPFLKRAPSLGVFPVDKSRFCFLCTRTGESLSGARFSVQSIRCLFRYLGMERGKMISGRGMGEGLRGAENNCQFKVNLCEECAFLNGQFTEVYQQLERIQMEVASCLQRVETKLKAEMEPSYSSKRLPDWVQTVKGLRREAVKKCDRKRRTFSPRVLVKKLAVPEVTQAQLSLRGEETSRDETKVQSDSDMDSHHCEAVSEAGPTVTVGEEEEETDTASLPLSKPHAPSDDEHPDPDSEATWSRASSSTDEEISKEGDALFLRDLLEKRIKLSELNAPTSNNELAKETHQDPKELIGAQLKSSAKEGTHKGGTKFHPDMDFSPCEVPAGAVTEIEIVDEIKTESSPQPRKASEVDAAGAASPAPTGSLLDPATMTSAPEATFLPSPIIEPSPMSVEEMYERSSFNPITAQCECLTCGKVLSGKGTFLQHYRIVHLGVKYKCEICGKVSTTRSNYIKHYKSLHLNLRYECSVCRKAFTDKVNYQQHYESVHLGSSKFKCGVCRKSYSSKRCLWRHQRSCQDNPRAMEKPEIDFSPSEIPLEAESMIGEEEIQTVSSTQPIPRDPLGDMAGEDGDEESDAFSLYEGGDRDSDSNYSEDGESVPTAALSDPDPATMTVSKVTGEPSDMNSSPDEVPSAEVSLKLLEEEIKSEGSPQSRDASGNERAEDEESSAESDDNGSLYEGGDSEADSDSDSDDESSHSEDSEAAAPPPHAATSTAPAPKVTGQPVDMDSSPCGALTGTGLEINEDEIKTESESLPQPKLHAGSEDYTTTMTTTAPKDTKKPSPIIKSCPLSAKEIEQRCSFNPETGKRKCKTCGGSYTERGGFIRHYKTVHLGLRVTCEICGKLFSEMSKYLKHYKRVHLNLNILMDTDSSPCVAPTGTGTGPEIYEEEIKTEQSSPKPHPSPEDEDEPPPPDSATMTTTTALKDTRKPSPIIEPHPMPKEEILERCSVNPITERIKCRTCGKFYREKHNFIRHYRSAHLREKCKCEICGKVFAARGHYLKHFKKAHLDIRYECSVCKKSFSDRFTYQQHYKAVHMKVKLKCGVCNKSFSGKANLWIHEKYTCKDNPKAKGEKPKPRPKPKPKPKKKKEPGFRQLCEACGKPFKSEGQFKRHMALELCKKDKDTDKEPVEKKKPGRKKEPVPEEGFSWVCHICGKVITSKKHKGHLTKHVKKCKERNGLTD